MGHPAPAARLQTLLLRLSKWKFPGINVSSESSPSPKREGIIKKKSSSPFITHTQEGKGRKGRIHDSGELFELITYQPSSSARSRTITQIYTNCVCVAVTWSTFYLSRSDLLEEPSKTKMVAGLRCEPSGPIQINAQSRKWKKNVPHVCEPGRVTFLK